MKDHYKLLLLVSVISFAFSCKRVTDPIGPEYKIPSADFAMLAPFAAVNPSVNFSINESEVFTAEFSEEVTWKITLKGLSSGATKSYNGFSKKLDASNNLWTGKHEGLYFFRSGEKVLASLTFLGSDILFTDTVDIVYARSWDIPGKIVTALTLEKAAYSPEYQFYDGPADYFPTYKVTNPFKGGVLSDMSTADNNRIEALLRDTEGDVIPTEIAGSIEGDKLYRLAGQDGIYTGTGYSDYFIGGTGLAKGPYGLDSVASNVYFNIYVYGLGDPNTKFVMNFGEDDNKNGAFDEGNQSENYAVKEDEYTYGIPVTWTGWKLVSVKYSDLVLSADGAKAINGNKKLEPHKLKKLGFVLLSLSKGGKASVRFDFGVFTMGKPFNPNE
ncbi:MAG: hypothetical protein ACKOXB_14905 [Flavobacteriales bacterium]